MVSTLSRADVDGDHVRALRREPQRVRAPLSAAGAGDQRDLPVNESHLCQFSFRGSLTALPAGHYHMK